MADGDEFERFDSELRIGGFAVLASQYLRLDAEVRLAAVEGGPVFEEALDALEAFGSSLSKEELIGVARQLITTLRLAMEVKSGRRES